MKFKNLLVGVMLLLIMAPQNAFANEIEDTKEWEEIRLEQVGNYTPDMLEEWTRLFEVRDENLPIREELSATLETLIETKWLPFIDEIKLTTQDALLEYRNALKVSVDHGDMTKEEARLDYEIFKESQELYFIKSVHEDGQVMHEEIKVYAEALREQRAILNQSITLSIESDTTDDISNMLNEILAINQLLETHHYEVNDLIEERIEYIEYTVND